MDNEYFYDLDTEIILLQTLVNDVHVYKQLCEEGSSDPEQYAMNHEALNAAVEQYFEQKNLLLPRLENWFQMCHDGEEPYDINYFRILKELREQKNRGY